LRSRGAPPKIVDLIQDLHDGTTCALQLDSHDSQNWFPVCTGFKQGDVNAPLLFNVFIDSIVWTFEPAVCQLGLRWAYKIDGNLREAKNPSVEGISWIFMYADDIALVTESEESMRAAMDIVYEAFRKWGLHINILKTKIMKLKYKDEPDACNAVQLMLGSADIETVKKFKYLGAVCSADMSMRSEISNRLSKAGKALHKLTNMKIWGDSAISRKTKMTLYKVVVQSVLLYGCETWAITVQDTHRLEVFQMRCLRKVLGITLLDRIPNARVRSECDVPMIANIISHRRLRWLGHVGRMSRDRMPLQLMFSVLYGESKSGRPSKSWNDYVREDLDKVGLLYDWWRKCQDRISWQTSIAVLLKRT